MQMFETKTIWIVKFRYDLVLPRFDPELKSRILVRKQRRRSISRRVALVQVSVEGDLRERRTKK
jgi:hypothetical protein